MFHFLPYVIHQGVDKGLWYDKARCYVRLQGAKKAGPTDTKIKKFSSSK